MSELWVERHRPKTVKDIRGQSSVVQRLISYADVSDFPHLLFAGPPGTGKTTAAMALTRDIYGDEFRNNLLEMNASDERKLELYEDYPILYKKMYFKLQLGATSIVETCET